MLNYSPCCIFIFMYIFFTFFSYIHPFFQDTFKKRKKKIFLFLFFTKIKQLFERTTWTHLVLSCHGRLNIIGISKNIQYMHHPFNLGLDLFLLLLHRRRLPWFEVFNGVDGWRWILYKRQYPQWMCIIVCMIGWRLLRKCGILIRFMYRCVTIFGKSIHNIDSGYRLFYWRYNTCFLLLIWLSCPFFVGMKSNPQKIWFVRIFPFLRTFHNSEVEDLKLMISFEMFLRHWTNLCDLMIN